MSSDILNKHPLVFNKNDFGDSFFWGMSSGECDLRKKKANIFFSNTKNQNLSNDHTLDLSNIENYKHSIDSLKRLGLLNFRFSLSWSRILPNGIGPINNEAITFYHSILDYCIANGIQPFVSLHDSFLPLELEKNGGWSNREILQWFENYVSICVNAFKGKVNYWIVLNEPSVFTGVGYFLGIYSLGKKGSNNFLSALHHALLCQSIGFKVIKTITPEVQVGAFFSGHYVVSNTYNDKDMKAVERIDALLNRTFIEPHLGLGYPVNELPFLKNIAKFTIPGDNDIIKVDFDFIGLQNCTIKIISHDACVPYINAKIIQYDNIRVKKDHLSAPIYEELIYIIIKKYSKYEGIKKIVIVENVTFYPEETNQNATIAVQKTNNMNLFLQHQMLNAKRIGDKVNGYFVSILEEFKPQ